MPCVYAKPYEKDGHPADVLCGLTAAVPGTRASECGSHPEAEPAAVSELGVQQFPFPVAKGAPPSDEVTFSSARRLGAALTERDNSQREADGAQSAPGSRVLPYSGLQPKKDARQNANDDGLCPPKFEEHR
ncbi:uncharacterized protein PHALS_00127 [Plasmopara halstedii]|uniref:Uncharacterized protein n=1 Tax=Plasmopara halstedii TaxID=4781 RepID=A0A0P1A5G4_PLAHL|nr:uncharacterized protein PHALS_00127 [Plasmopara halstedii]CEG35796.1 hypothetical protein PHALS_00127 [Plasmopara halstedii]|eukprot:XP_024572165.1 hypothetical protein PHALS_00127 [Plasmopara halstedii]